MAVTIKQTAGLLVEKNTLTMFDSGCDEIIDSTTFDECNSSVSQIPDGTTEELLPITGMEISRLIYLRSDKELKFKAVPPGGTLGTTTEYTLTPGVASFLGFAVEAIYITNDTGDLAELIQAYVGTNI
jgi:hypothetical protein